MPEISLNDLENYNTPGDFEYLTLKDDGDIAKVRFYIESMDDLRFNVVHQVVDKNGKRRYVNCLRTYDQPLEDCPLCADSLKNKDHKFIVKLFLPVLDLDDNKVKIFERGKSFKNEIEGYIRRNAPLVNYPCEIERNGAKGSTDTTYKVYPLAQEKDETMIKDLPERPQLLGSYILEMDVEQMKHFLETGILPSTKEVTEELPRRTTRTETTQEEKPARKASRF